MPEMGGYFLEYNNFIPADPLKTPPHIAPVWYFTPYYSILRAITEDFMWVLALGGRCLRGADLCRSGFARHVEQRVAVAVQRSLLEGLFTVVLEAKVWGVVLMGRRDADLLPAAVARPEPGEVDSLQGTAVRRRALTMFVVVFLVLGYLGTQSVTDGRHARSRRSARSSISRSSC